MAPTPLRRHVLGWLAAHPGRGSDVRSIASEAGLSREHFSRSFRRETGETVAAFARRRRLRDAARALAEGEGTADQPAIQHRFQANFY